ncbi:unnamed protein product [Sphagnum troendelagicum]|uniref:Uncharacterized protein n=1 Tax=Sphagnum troendelagicum TaxID=128251 RepID=A0ABP0TZI5_9BRYO
MEIDLELREPYSPEVLALPKSPAAPSVPSPERSAVKTNAMSYDEEEVERSRHFAQALKELKNLRPQLYSAAEYCESSYLYSDQKQAVLDNLKEYSVKALVNAVDHLGTVAYKFNELLGQETTGISSTELRAASLAQRMRSCQEHSDREGLKQQSLAKTLPVNHKHYVLPDPYAIVEENATTTILRERFDSSQMQSKSQQPLRQSKASNPTAEPQLLPHSKDPSPSLHITSSNESWHFASDVAPISISTASTGQRQPISAGQRVPPPASGSKVLETSLPKGSFLSSSLYNVKSLPKSVEAGLSSSKYPNSAKVSATRSGSFTPIKTAPPAHGKGGPLSRSSTMVPEIGSTKDSRPRSKSLLRMLLSRRKS